MKTFSAFVQRRCVDLVNLEHRHPMRWHFVRIENRRVPGVVVLIIENEVCCNFGVVPNRERDLALNCFLKLDYLRTKNLRIEN